MRPGVRISEYGNALPALLSFFSVYQFFVIWLSTEYATGLYVGPMKFTKLLTYLRPLPRSRPNGAVLGCAIRNELLIVPVSPDAVAVKVHEPTTFSERFVVVRAPAVAAPDFVPDSVMPVQVPPVFAIVIVLVADPVELTLTVT